MNKLAPCDRLPSGALDVIVITLELFADAIVSAPVKKIGGGGSAALVAKKFLSKIALKINKFSSVLKIF